MTFKQFWKCEADPHGDLRDLAEHAWNEATLAERERCAKIADGFHRIDTPGEIGEAIRDAKS